MNKPAPAGTQQRFGHAAAQRPERPDSCCTSLVPPNRSAGTPHYVQTSGRKDWECLWIGINIYLDKIQNHHES